MVLFKRWPLPLWTKTEGQYSVKHLVVDRGVVKIGTTWFYFEIILPLELVLFCRDVQIIHGHDSC